MGEGVSAHCTMLGSIPVLKQLIPEAPVPQMMITKISPHTAK